MANADTLIGNEFRFQVGDGNSPEQFTDMCAVAEANGIGEESPLVKITTLCSEAEEYRPGLPDGLEFPLVVNFAQGDTQIQGLYLDYKSKTRRNFRLMIADSSPAEYIEFTAIIRGWNFSPPSSDKVSVNFTLKTTGAVNWIFEEAA